MQFNKLLGVLLQAPLSLNLKDRGTVTKGYVMKTFFILSSILFLVSCSRAVLQSNVAKSSAVIQTSQVTKADNSVPHVNTNPIPLGLGEHGFIDGDRNVYIIVMRACTEFSGVPTENTDLVKITCKFEIIVKPS